jgi:hypothetical protein
VGEIHVRLSVGDAVRVRPNPEVDETLWDEQGLVLDVDRDNRVLVELGEEGDRAFNPHQLDLIAPTEDQGPDAPGPFGP